MVFVEFPDILPLTLIVGVSEYPVVGRLGKVELGNGGFFNSGDGAGEAGVDNVDSAESKSVGVFRHP